MVPLKMEPTVPKIEGPTVPKEGPAKPEGPEPSLDKKGFCHELDEGLVGTPFEPPLLFTPMAVKLEIVESIVGGTVLEMVEGTVEVTVIGMVPTKMLETAVEMASVEAAELVIFERQENNLSCDC
jgi:hypothetical protein